MKFIKLLATLFFIFPFLGNANKIEIKKNNPDILFAHDTINVVTDTSLDTKVFFISKSKKIELKEIKNYEINGKRNKYYIIPLIDLEWHEKPKLLIKTEKQDSVDSYFYVGKNLRINLPKDGTQTAELFEGNYLIKSALCSGSKYFNEDLGANFVGNKLEKARSAVAKNFFFKWWLRIEPCDPIKDSLRSKSAYNGVHEIPFEEDIKKLGQPASRGCIRLDPKNSKEFYYYSYIGMPIFIMRSKKELPNIIDNLKQYIEQKNKYFISSKK